VEEVIPVLRPYQLASREFHSEDTVVEVGGVTIGGTNFTVIAGPCAVEDRDLLFEIARKVKAAGAQLLRGGAFKPRTSPYSFQGLGEEGLELLREVSQEVGLPVVTEVLDTRDVELVATYADMLQIGARNMQNFRLLEEAGQTGKPILLKRGMSATVKDWLLAAEYILRTGNSQVVLCERGIRTFDNSCRFTLDLAAVPNVQYESHLPVIVDPSHASGKWRLIEPLSRAAVAVGAHGIMVEVHSCPERALCDGEQALLPDRFQKLMEQVRGLVACLGRTMS